MKAEDLKKYLGDFTIISESRTVDYLPELWRPIFVHGEQEDRVTATINMWSSYYRDKLSSLLNTFNKFLKRVDLVQVADSFSVLYTFEINGELRFYLGKNPDKKQDTEDVQAFLHGLPDDFIFFYENIHNGWYEVVSEAMGLMPIEDFIILAEQDWGILDTIRITFSLHKVVGVFSNSAGGYLCWDYNHVIPTGLIWWHDEAPDIDVDFWAVLDEWTSLGIDEEGL